MPINFGTNSDSLPTQMLRLNNTGEKTPNLASFGFTGIFNVSFVKNSCLILCRFLQTPRPGLGGGGKTGFATSYNQFKLAGRNS